MAFNYLIDFSARHPLYAERFQKPHLLPYLPKKIFDRTGSGSLGRANGA
jgi:hypothetical protein